MVDYVDSHTAGEPTRVVIAGGPELGGGSLQERAERFARVADDFRCRVIDEPRGHEAVVGALLCEPVDPSCAAGVIFFNNTGLLGMCGHGAIGVAVTLAYLKRIEPGFHKLETPVGTVGFQLIDSYLVEIHNVPSYRLQQGVQLQVDGIGRVTGDVAWGGNWFFLADSSPLPLRPENITELTRLAWNVRRELQRQGITGANGAEIDHIEFFGPAVNAEAHSRNFVLCPGGAYDRSPCGTGTSAKLACLAAKGTLQAGQTWVQESIIGSRFAASYEPAEAGQIRPAIRGSAYVCNVGRIIVQAGDPFANGLFHGQRIDEQGQRADEGVA